MTAETEPSEFRLGGRFLALGLPDPEATRRLGGCVGALLHVADRVLLDGPLGAGKTHLVRGLADGLGIPEARVSSPTYILMQEYADPDGDSPILLHVDAYRLDGPEAFVAALGDVADPEATGDRVVLAIEWPTRIGIRGPERPRDWGIQLVHAAADGRRVRIAAPDEASHAALLQAAETAGLR